MTREEILINSIWTSGKMQVYSNFFQKEVRIDLFTSNYNLKNTDKIVSEKFVLAVNDFLQLPTDSSTLLKKLLYKHCLACCEHTSYGFDILDGETETQANLREFGVSNEEAAFEKSYINHIVIDESEQNDNRYVRMVFYPVWEEEHGCELIIKNGVLLNYFGESGTYIGQFDNEIPNDDV